MNDLIHRNASPWISDLLDHFPVVVLQGGRQVGKSTLAADIAGHRHGNIVTMDRQRPDRCHHRPRREIGRPKVFLPDSALAMHLSGISEDQLTAHEEYFGALLEGFVAAELRRQQTWSEDDYRLHAYRNSNNREVDCLIELADGRVIAIEVKASSTVRTTYFRHLEFLREELGDRLIAGIVLSTAPEPGRFGDRMWALPVSSLWELGTSAGTLRP